MACIGHSRRFALPPDPLPPGEGAHPPSHGGRGEGEGDLIPLTAPPAAPARRGSSLALGVLPLDHRDFVREIENARNPPHAVILRLRDVCCFRRERGG